MNADTPPTTIVIANSGDASGFWRLRCRQLIFFTEVWRADHPDEEETAVPEPLRPDDLVAAAAIIEATSEDSENKALQKEDFEEVVFKWQSNRQSLQQTLTAYRKMLVKLSAGHEQDIEETAQAAPPDQNGRPGLSSAHADGSFQPVEPQPRAEPSIRRRELRPLSIASAAGARGGRNVANRQSTSRQQEARENANQLWKAHRRVPPPEEEDPGGPAPKRLPTRVSAQSACSRDQNDEDREEPTTEPKPGYADRWRGPYLDALAERVGSVSLWQSVYQPQREEQA